MLNTGVSGTAILDEDNMASDSATKLATQQSIKAYVDAQVTAQDLDLWIKMALKYDVAFNPKITMSYKSYVDNSLSKSKYNDIRYEFINNFSKKEKENYEFNH